MRQHTTAGLLIIAAIFVSAASAAAAADATRPFPKAGEWPALKRTAARDAYSPLKGGLASPELRWSVSIERQSTLVVARETEAPNGVYLPAPADAAISPSDSRWTAPIEHVTVAGASVPNVSGGVIAYGEVLPDGEGLERFSTGHVFDSADGIVRCEAWRDGAWTEAWSVTLPFGNSVQTPILVDDFDADGKKEVAVLPWYCLFILDAETGATKYDCNFTPGRNYGYLGAHDLNNDGPIEFVVQADFSKHVDVLGFQDGQLQLLWQENIELVIDDPQRILRVNPDCVSDINGDGALDVLICTYNHKDTGRWELSLRDGMTGREMAHLKDVYLNGVTDLDGDGKAELLLSLAPDRVLPLDGRITVHGWRDGTLRQIWFIDPLAWVMVDKAIPPNISTGATLAARSVLCRGPDCALRFPKRRILLVMRWTGDSHKSLHGTRGDWMEPIALDEAGSLLMRVGYVASGATSLLVRVGYGASAALNGWPATFTVGPTSPDRAAPAPIAVVRPEGGNRSLIVAQSSTRSGGMLIGLEVHPDGGGADVAWRKPGRAQSDNWPNIVGPVAGDLLGDGRRQVLYASQAPMGCARLIAIDIDGTSLWEYDFPNIPGTPPVWNTGGIIRWQTGHFTDPGRQDVLVHVRRSMMHSDEIHLLRGTDGVVLWHKTRLRTAGQNRGAGGQPFALADFDGDGLDDLASLYPSLLAVLKGSTGDLLYRLRPTRWIAAGQTTYYWGRPIACGIGNDVPDLLMAGTSLTALIDVKGNLLWHDKTGTASGPYVIGAFDGGDLQSVGAGFDDGFRCYDLATGEVRWHFEPPTGPAATGAAALDADADGRDEVVYTAGNQICCIGVDAEGAPTLLWQVAVPNCATIGPPAIADIDADGLAEILLVGDDGQLHCLGDAVAQGDGAP